MDAATRRSLHAVAELLVAGPQYRAHGTIKLRVTPGGFGGWVLDTRVEGATLVFGSERRPLTGRYRDLVPDAGAPSGLYHDGCGVDLDDEIAVDAVAAVTIAEAFARGDSALRELDATIEPVLWPEHFDIGIRLDEVNYGVSPGDGFHADPYAYVSPNTVPDDPFWNAPFGVARALTEIDDVALFFRETRDRLS